MRDFRMDHRTGSNLSGTSCRHPGSKNSAATAGYTYADMRCYQSPLHQTAAAVQRFRKCHEGVLVANYDHTLTGSGALRNPAKATPARVLPPRGNGRSYPGCKEIGWIVQQTVSNTDAISSSAPGAVSTNAPVVPNASLPHRGDGRNNPGAAESKSAVSASSIDCCI